MGIRSDPGSSLRRCLILHFHILLRIGLRQLLRVIERSILVLVAVLDVLRANGYIPIPKVIRCMAKSLICACVRNCDFSSLRGDMRQLHSCGVLVARRHPIPDR